MSKIRTGWTVWSRDRQELGTVVAIAGGELIIAARTPLSGRLRIPSHYVGTQDERSGIAVISLDAREAQTAITRD